MKRKMIFVMLAVLCLVLANGCVHGGVKSGAPCIPEADHTATMDLDSPKGEGSALLVEADDTATMVFDSPSEKRNTLPAEAGRPAAVQGGSRSEAGAHSQTAPNAAPIGEGRAGAIALKHAGLAESEVSRLEMEFDREDGRQVYEVGFYAGNKEYEYEIDVYSGAILSYKCEIKRAAAKGSKCPEATISAGEGDLIGKEAALAAALKHAALAESEVLSVHVELDYEAGRQVYEVEFRTDGREYDYEIDARRGEVLACDVENRRSRP